MSCSFSSIEERSTASSQSIEESCGSSIFWSVTTASFSSIEEIKKERNRGVSMLTDERDTIGEELQREEEPHESLSSSPSSSTAEKGCTGVLRCFARCQFRVSC